MTDYKAPLRDIRFVADELWDYDKHYQSLSGTEDVNSELRDAILEEAAKFAEQVIAPLRRSGDEEGCTWSEDGVTTPSGFKEAYKQFIDGGWCGLSMPEEFGGQALPASLELMTSELIAEANQSCLANTHANAKDEQTDQPSGPTTQGRHQRKYRQADDDNHLATVTIGQASDRYTQRCVKQGEGEPPPTNRVAHQKDRTPL